MNINGLEAAVLAADDSRASVRTYVPGYPITDLAAGLRAEVSINEKVALEIALGASATGVRSLVIVKQVGMNILADPLVISATHNIGSGLVVIAGDDLGPRGSQVEMDSRLFGPLSQLPLLDPCSPASLYASILEAYALSEDLRVPVIVRVTAQLLAAEGAQIASQLSPGTGQMFERIKPEPTMRGLLQRHRNITLAAAAKAAESSGLNRLHMQKGSHVGIIASGRAAHLARGLSVSLLSLAYTNPLPWRLIHRFMNEHSLILVAEEPGPFIESYLGRRENVSGKLTGHLPWGELKREDIARAVEELKSGEKRGSDEMRDSDEERDSGENEHALQQYETVADRGNYAGVCADCPFASLFLALKEIEVPVAGDAGCSIRASREPYQSVDVVYGLGSSVGVASGFEGKGIALVGDYALAHSGLQALINAMWQKRDLLVVVLKNDAAAMTGGQDVPDLTLLLEALVPVRYLDLPAPLEELRLVLQEELKRPGPSAVVAREVCPRHISPVVKKP